MESVRRFAASGAGTTLAALLLLVPTWCTAQPIASPSPMRTVPAANEPVSPNAIVHAGTVMLIEWHGSWYDGHVVATSVEGPVRIHYEGYGDGDDETVPRARLRFGHRPQPSGVATPPPGTSPASARTLIEAGQTVVVNYRSNYYRAHVTAVLDDGALAVRYEGWGSESDEIVSRDRVLIITGAANEPPSTFSIDGRQASLAIGSQVEIESGGTWYRGRVIALLESGQARVHYTGWSNDTDENVPRSRLRVAHP